MRTISGYHRVQQRVVLGKTCLGRVCVRTCACVFMCMYTACAGVHVGHHCMHMCASMCTQACTYIHEHVCVVVVCQCVCVSIQRITRSSRMRKVGSPSDPWQYVTIVRIYRPCSSPERHVEASIHVF